MFNTSNAVWGALPKYDGCYCKKNSEGLNQDENGCGTGTYLNVVVTWYEIIYSGLCNLSTP